MESLVSDTQRLIDKIRNIEQEIQQKERLSVESIAEKQRELEEKVRAFEEDRKEFQLLQDKIRLNSVSVAEKVKLNVGGTKFETLKTTLLVQNSYFEALFGSEWKPETGTSYFIDRDPFYFARILAYLRTKKLNTVGLSEQEILDLRAEFDYFQIPFPDANTTASDSTTSSPPSSLPDSTPLDEKEFWAVEKYPSRVSASSSTTAYGTNTSWFSRDPCYSRTECDCPWVIIDLGISLFPSKYKFGHARNTEAYAMRDWSLEASSDKKNWVRLKEHKNDNTLQKSFQVAEWSLPAPSTAFRYFRLSSLTYMHIYHFDVFGKEKTE